MTAGLPAAVVDSSALICIAKSEPAANYFLQELAATDQLYMSAATQAEIILATMSIMEDGALDSMEALIASLKITTVDFSGADVRAYRQAALAYHLKARPPGALNMGDIFSFQLAQKMDIPLFFQGKDFLKTPVRNAMEILGYEMNEQNLGVPRPMT